jgi:Resolvase, N terminal domain
MPIQQHTLKIRPDHLSRQAVIYVRQSTLLQVRENIGSTTRQYDLSKRAHELGWEQAGIEVIDQDQGQSGSSTIGRDGFQTLVAEVGLGHVGAVLSRGASLVWLARAVIGIACWKSVPSLRHWSLTRRASTTRDRTMTVFC